MSVEFNRLIQIISQLRAPDGCPWDRKQTPKSLRSCLIEECYEAINAIDKADNENILEELGDILLNVVMISEIYKERNIFTIDDVLKNVNEKLIRRHPHVFGNNVAKDPETALNNWNKEKEKEKQNNIISSSILKDIPSTYPALLKAWEIQQKVSKVGFDWNNIEDVKGKIFEELREIEDAKCKNDLNEIEMECGDFLFSVVNYIRHLKVNPEIALNQANTKFSHRFQKLESRCDFSKSHSLKELDKLWNEIKKEEY